MKRLATSGLVLLLFLGGCAPRVNLTYLSNPNGATIYQGGRCLGEAPSTVEYQFTDIEGEYGRKILPEVKAVWPSGATLELKSITVLAEQGHEQVFSLPRPDNHPNRHIDIQHATELEKLRIMRQQAWTAEQARREQAYQAFRPKRSTSTIIGNTIYTTTE